MGVVLAPVQLPPRLSRHLVGEVDVAESISLQISAQPVTSGLFYLFIFFILSNECNKNLNKKKKI